MSRARLRWSGDAASAAIHSGLLRGLTLAGELTLQATRQRVPIAEGTLERSGATSVDEATMTAAVSYDTPYAVRMHEDMTAQHSPGRTAKYIEAVLPEVAGEVQAVIAAQVRRELRG
ncbi:hypothetical protein ACIQWR_32475 [Streptomyces sp. NPDC098789]|uniref:hypothetical protein n=1 Tax=Streptomyces sp. NPDC098789 TaxID=3366098 RepID=UPI00382C8A75